MRIALVTATFPPYHGGTGNVCYHNALELVRLGHEVTVFTADYPPGEYVYPDALRVRRLPVAFRAGNAPILPGLLKLDGYDVIHLQHPFIFGAEMTWLVSMMRGIPYVLTHQNDLIGDGLRRHLFNAYSALSGRLVFGGARKFVVVSLDHAAHCRLAPLLRARWDDVVEVPNGVDTELFRPGLDGAEVRRRHGIPAGARVILFVGTLDRAHHFKGVGHLLRALSRIGDRNTKLVLVGDGDLKEGFVDQARDLGVSERVCFAGAQSHERLAAYYAAADVLVLPSFPPESFGMVLIEAMSCARPVVAHDIPGVRSVVDAGQDGLLARPGDVDDLVEKIELLLADPERRRAMGDRGRAKVEERYAWSKIGPMLEQLYKSVIRPTPLGGGQEAQAR